MKYHYDSTNPFPKKVSTKSKALGALKRIKNAVVKPFKEASAEIEDKNKKENDKYQQMSAAGIQDAGNESDPLFRHRINEINKAFDAEQERKRSQESSLRSVLRKK